MEANAISDTETKKSKACCVSIFPRALILEFWELLKQGQDLTIVVSTSAYWNSKIETSILETLLSLFLIKWCKIHQNSSTISEEAELWRDKRCKKNMIKIYCVKNINQKSKK